jgi:hypothetical protein
MLYRFIFALMLSLALAACGGGGGSPGNTSSTTPTTVIPSSTATTSTFITPTVANITLSNFSATSVALASGANTGVSITVLSNGLPTSTPVIVQLYATCGSINGVASSAAAPVAVTTNGSGVAQADYSSIRPDNTLCSGPVRIFANTASATQLALDLIVAAPVANSIQFISAAPARIFVAGSGAAERSQVTFRVFGNNGSALGNVSVQVSVVTNPGGISLGTPGVSTPITVDSDASGDVKVDVFSGSIPGPVKVRAQLVSNATVFSESQNLSVASGPPSQRFMSVSVEKFNIEGWAVDGTSTRITARIADRQGNAVQDGTVVNFTTESGQASSSCVTSRVNDISSCSVEFISQNPRTTGGRVSVLAYLEGSKEYVDNNANNIFDAGDTLINIGNAYRDDNEDGVFTPGEFLINRGGSGICAGSSGVFPAQLNTCDATAVTTVRQQVVILYSSSEALLTDLQVSRSFISGAVRSADNTLLPMPVGTTISTEVTGSGSCAVDKQFGSPVVNVNPGTNPNADLATGFSATFKDCGAGSVAFVNVQSPGGLRTTFGPYVLP